MRENNTAVANEKEQTAEKNKDLRATHDEVTKIIKSGSWEERKEFFASLGELLESGKEINSEDNNNQIRF